MNQHAALALLSIWLSASSPWLGMLRRIPSGAGWLDYAHVGLGLLTMVLVITYTWSCVREGGWRLYFPFAAPQAAAVRNDLAGLLRGRMPAAEAGGLFGLVEGLLLVALAATAVTGTAWFITQGADVALGWRVIHVYAARSLVALLILHVVTVSLHLLDFVRD
jgi:hypothetical protein